MFNILAAVILIIYILGSLITLYGFCLITAIVFFRLYDMIFDN